MGQAHWNGVARRWHLVGPPLRPCREDIALFEKAASDCQREFDRSLRALILGVTPELVTMKWPHDTQLWGLDASPRMVEALWQGPAHRALVGAWSRAPLPDDSLDLMLCDGGLGLQSWPHGQRSLLEEAARLLAPGGLFVVRLFVPGAREDALAAIAADLEAGRIPSLDALKFRLWGVLQASPATGVRPPDVVREIERMAGDLPWLTRALGWPAEHVATLELHRDNPAVYCLSDVDMVGELTAEISGLSLVDTNYPDHAFGDCCPVVVLQRNQAY